MVGVGREARALSHVEEKRSTAELIAQRRWQACAKIKGPCHCEVKEVQFPAQLETVLKLGM